MADQLRQWEDLAVAESCVDALLPGRKRSESLFADLDLRFLDEEGGRVSYPFFPKCFRASASTNAAHGRSGCASPTARSCESRAESASTRNRTSSISSTSARTPFRASQRRRWKRSKVPTSSKCLGGKSNMLVTEMRQRVYFVKFSQRAAVASCVKSGTRGIWLESAALAGREPLYYLESFIPPNNRRLDVSAS